MIKYRGNLEFETYYGATGGVVMRMNKPLFGTGEIVVMDSGFFVLKGLVGMLAHGLCETTVIKKYI